MNIDSKYAWIYFTLSSVVSGLILLLFFLSMQVVVYDQRKVFLFKSQKFLEFVKPKNQFITNYYGHQWTFIGNAKYGHQIYSAYFDHRTQLYNNKDWDEEKIYYGGIRILAFLPHKLRNGITCIIKFESNSTHPVKASEIRPIHKYEDIGGNFTFYMIMCPLYRHFKASNITILPSHVAITYMENPSSVIVPTFISISFSKTKILDKPRNALAICVGSYDLNHNYTSSIGLIEFIELYKLLGAEKFYFYRFNSTYNITQILNYYHREGIIKMSTWNFNVEIYKEKLIRSNIAAQNIDCIYRTFLDGYNYTAIIDIDEFLIPYEYNNLMDFLKDKDEGRTSAFIFRKVLFYKKRPNDFFSVPPNIKNRYLTTQIKNKRTETPLPQGIKSRYIAKSNTIIETGLNGIWKSTEGHTETHIKPEEGLVFHYRKTCYANTCGASTITDFTIRRFGSLLWNNVENICKIIFLNGICAL